MERWDDVARVMVDGAIAQNDRRALAEAMNQAFGKPKETVEVDQKPVDLTDYTQLTLEQVRAASSRRASHTRSV